MTTIKKCKLWLISVLAVAFVSAFGLFLGTNFKVAQAADETADTTFEMVGGTSLRLEGGGGIRFRVKMGNGIKSKLKEDATTLNFLIAPRAAFNAAGRNYDALVAKAAPSTNGSRVAAIMEADKSKLYDENGYTYSNLVITNVKEANRTLDMCVLAYYTKGETKTYAKFDIERVRGNLYDVTNQAALTNKEYAEKIFANTEDYAWYGTGNYPVVVDTQVQLDVLKQVDYSGKTVLVNDESLTVPAGMNKVTSVDLKDDKEIVLGDDTSYPVGNLGEYSSATIIKATLGGKAVVYSGGNVTLNADYKANRKAHGEKILTVTVKKDGKYFNVNKNVLVVTKEIASVDEWKTALANNLENNAIYGYYRLKSDIGGKGEGISTGADIDGTVSGEMGFKGTIEGNNHSLTGVSYSSAFFGVIGKGAVIKNITINEYGYEDRFKIFGKAMSGATLENVTINVNGKGTTTEGRNGLLTASFCYNTTFTNVNITVNCKYDTLLGIANTVIGDNANTFKNCSVNAKSSEYFGQYAKDGKSFVDYPAELPIKLPHADVVATTDLVLGEEYEYALDLTEINSVKMNGEIFDKYSFENGTLKINADAFDYTDIGSALLAIVGKVEGGYTVEFNFTFTIKVITTEKPISGTKEVVLGNGNEYNVDLGDYSSATVLSATIGGEKATYANGKLTLTDEFKANTQKHGNQELSVIVEKDGAYYNVTTNVLVITQEIKTVDEVVQVSGKIYGYYRLANNLLNMSNKINVTGSGDWKNADGQSGFRGTFDGNDKTISCWSTIYGLFGIVGQGAVIKNLTYTLTAYEVSGTTLARSITGATIENVTINVLLAKPGVAIDKEGGVITGLMSQNTLYKNVTINAKGQDIDSLFGTSWNCYKESNANTFVNCKVFAKSLAGLINAGSPTVPNVVSAEGIKDLTITKE